MKHIYERTAKFAKLGSLFAFGVYVLLVIIFHNVLWEDFETHFMVGFMLFMLLGSSFYFQNAAEKLPDEQEIDSQYYSDSFPIKELNFQRDVSIIPKSYLVSNTGERLYIITPTENHPFIRKLSSFAIFKMGMFFPITYELKTMDGKLVSQFTMQNKLKFMQLKVYDHTKTHISTVALPVISVKNRAIIFGPNHEKLHQMEAKSMYGDIDVDDFNGKRLATYRFGMFPYATHPAFQIQAMNIHVSLAEDLTHAEKLTFTALFYYWTATK
ncbi:hypothetical protein [Bacillus sp. FJAT-22090]|uniref:hypothetical protein n=1 Tax=Bacillus sp. FJAT-22090 TaxID=1581038 RepID=UPI0011A9E2EC|nr:hypothetical protein [Bacillus sp. FJAT-22090]